MESGDTKYSVSSGMQQFIKKDDLNYFLSIQPLPKIKLFWIIFDSEVMKYVPSSLTPLEVIIVNANRIKSV